MLVTIFFLIWPKTHNCKLYLACGCQPPPVLEHEFLIMVQQPRQGRSACDRWAFVYGNKLKEQAAGIPSSLREFVCNRKLEDSGVTHLSLQEVPVSTPSMSRSNGFEAQGTVKLCWNVFDEFQHL